MEEANAKKAETADLKEKSNQLSQLLSKAQDELKDKLVQIPNIPHDSVPTGNSEEDKKIVSQECDIHKLGDKAKTQL